MGSVSRTRRRVVVTGIGVLTPLGGSVDVSWRTLLSGASGARSLSSALTESYSPDSPSLGRDLELGAKLGYDVAAAVPTDAAREALDGSFHHRGQCVPENFLRDGSIPRFAALAVSKCLARYPADGDYIGVLVGKGMGRLAANIFRAASLLSLRKVSPHFVPRVLPLCAASFVARTFWLRGPISAPSMACVAGAQALADSYDAVAFFWVYVVVAEGSEACLHPISFAGF